MYDSNDLSRAIREAAITLKEKMMAKLPNLSILDYVNDKYTFVLNFYPPKFPSLPISEMALTFAHQFPMWFICGKDIKVLKNESLKPIKRVTPTKHDVYSFKGHLHVDINHVRVEAAEVETEPIHVEDISSKPPAKKKKQKSWSWH